MLQACAVWLASIVGASGSLWSVAATACPLWICIRSPHKEMRCERTEWSIVEFNLPNNFQLDPAKQWLYSPMFADNQRHLCQMGAGLTVSMTGYFACIATNLQTQALNCSGSTNIISWRALFEVSGWMHASTNIELAITNCLEQPSSVWWSQVLNADEVTGCT